MYYSLHLLELEECVCNNIVILLFQDVLVDDVTLSSDQKRWKLGVQLALEISVKMDAITERQVKWVDKVANEDWGPEIA